MKANKIISLVFLGLGGLLLAAGLILVLLGAAEDRAAQKNSQLLLDSALALEEEEPSTETSQPSQSENSDPTEETEPPTDPPDPPTLITEMVDGHEYVGYLEFPSLQRRLPIIKIVYMDDLQVAPCLEKGSPHTNDAVISAHNYPSHFGPIRDWTGGEEVIFTDLEGHVIHYTVQVVETISPYDVEKVMNSEYDLVLYTCTTGGANRVMLGCSRTENS